MRRPPPPWDGSLCVCLCCRIRLLLLPTPKVGSSGRSAPVANLKARHLSDGIFFLALIDEVLAKCGDEAERIRWDVVATGESEAPTREEKLLNAKYAISSARKMGATVFVTPEDIVDVKHKALLIFVASIWDAESKL